jgi:formylglycine-generating enzyme required for sulfatase activity
LPTQAGAGKHVHLADGGGLVVGSGDAGVAYETGWDPAWNAMFPSGDPDPNTGSMAQWTANLGCSTTAATWSANPSGDDLRPINCVTWYEAYAFCIWDGGFLPSEAEWNYAAAAGAQQRLYPWGSDDPSTGPYAVYGCTYPKSFSCSKPWDYNIAATTTAYPEGRGAFGQWNLAGNVAEWTLDLYAPAYPMPCVDCAELTSGTERVNRGGGFDRDIAYLYTSSRVPSDPMLRFTDVGIRCARVP